MKRWYSLIWFYNTTDEIAQQIRIYFCCTFHCVVGFQEQSNGLINIVVMRTFRK